MIKKVTTPIIEKFNGDGDLVVVGTRVEYRFIGILLYQKVLYTPVKYGVFKYDYYQMSI